MELNDYQAKSMRTANFEKMEPGYALLNAALGLNGEAGEFADLVKKAMFQLHPINLEKMTEEIGDVLWYCALAAQTLGTTLDVIAGKNIDKLLERYPDGFDAERSMHREGEKA